MSMSKPEDIMDEKKLRDLPVSMTDDTQAQAAIECIRSLFDPFIILSADAALDSQMTAKSIKARANKIRRTIAPAAVLAATCLYQRAWSIYKVNQDDLETGHFCADYQQVVKSLEANPSVEPFLRPYTMIQRELGAVATAPTKVPALAALRAALATNELNVDCDLQETLMKMNTSSAREKVKLAEAQWTAVKLFLEWQNEKGHLEHYAMLGIWDVHNHLSSIKLMSAIILTSE